MDNKLEFTFLTRDIETIENCIIDFKTRGYELSNRIEEGDRTKLIFEKSN